VTSGVVLSFDTGPAVTFDDQTSEPVTKRIYSHNTGGPTSELRANRISGIHDNARPKHEEAVATVAEMALGDG
jgi:hypothetical protein